MTRIPSCRAGMKLRATAAAAVIAMLALLNVPSARLVGQSAGPATGALSGTVVDSSGVPVAAAQVRVQDVEPATVTDQWGRFLFQRLDPGTWELAVSARGYRATTVPGVTVRAGETTRITVTLSRMVEAAAPGVQHPAAPLSSVALDTRLPRHGSASRAP